MDFTVSEAEAFAAVRPRRLAKSVAPLMVLTRAVLAPPALVTPTRSTEIVHVPPAAIVPLTASNVVSPAAGAKLGATPAPVQLASALGVAAT